MRKLVLIVCLWLVSLFGDAKMVLPDTMLTIEHAYYTTSTDTSLAIIQTMRERRLAQKWLLDMAEGDYCYATLDYTKALDFFKQAYACEEVRDSDDIQMELLKRLMQTNDILFNEAELVDNVHDLKQMALRHGNDAYLSMAEFVIGKRTHYHRHKQEGYELCVKALEMMKNSDYHLKQKVLCDYYAELLQMYMKDGRYDDALRMSLLQEEAVLHLKGPQAKNRETLRFVYALRASLQAKAGRQEEADIAYAKWQKEAEGNCVIDNAALDYLMLNGHYEEARDIIHNYCHMLRSQQDNYSYRMISMLTTGTQVAIALGNYEEAANHSREIRAIIDSLHIDRSNSLIQKTWSLIQAEEDVEMKKNLLNVLGIILLFGLFMGALALYYTRLIRHRNKRLLKALNVLEAYQNTAADQTPADASDLTSTTNPLEDAQASDEVAEGAQSADDENERLFVKLDTLITRNRLFLNPNFGRDDMARLIGVDKNRIGHIMAKYSDASNASVYINTKRVAYGARLLLKHPEYTIAAIATECGMTNTVTFNRTFREVYGMTPSQYRTNAQ